MSARYRILSHDFRILHTGGQSWMTLEQARAIVKPELGQRIYEYDTQGRQLWEVM